MSGFAAIFSPDSATVNSSVLDQMKSYLSFRGPDGQEARVLGPNGSVGLLHALFRTTVEPSEERQPSTINGKVWVVGHIRIDAREDLWPKLEAHGCQSARRAADHELVLHAYEIWGEECVCHLRGEFSFVIWDERERKLFCARDQLGVRPLFYAHWRGLWVISNTLECIRLYPGMPDELDESWVADFLMFGRSTELESSVYRAIRRLPPAHALTVTGFGEWQIKRYWTLQLGEPLYLKRSEEYAERFRDLVRMAVKDRVRASRIGVYLSGGLDSSTLAATAANLVPNPARDLVGYTFVFRKLIPDDEEYYAGLVASHLGIPLIIRNKDDACYDPEWWTRPHRTPEPDSAAYCKHADLQFAKEIAQESRVWLYGEGPDNALEFEWAAYLSWLWKAGRHLRIAKDVLSLFLLDQPASVVSDAWRRFRNFKEYRSPAPPPFPDWIQPDLAARLNLPQRWCDHWATQRGHHPWHPRSMLAFSKPWFRDLFEYLDPGSEPSAPPTETRHPYCDLRVLEYLLALPVVPWARRKLVIRKAMEGTLPQATIRRPKTALRADPWATAMRKHPVPVLNESRAVSRFIRVDRVPRQWPIEDRAAREVSHILIVSNWVDPSALASP